MVSIFEGGSKMPGAHLLNRRQAFSLAFTFNEVPLFQTSRLQVDFFFKDVKNFIHFPGLEEAFVEDWSRRVL